MHIDDFVKEHKKKKYIDFMLSIGLNCKPAINIMSNGFRFFSSPLDFVEVRTIESVLHLFESKFDSFFSNYKIDFSKKTATGCYWIDDLTNEIYTIHFMKKGMPILESYRKFKEAMNLRAKRLDDRLKKVSKIVIVSQRPESKEELTWFLNEFSNLYPNLCIDFINMRNDMKMSFDEIKVLNVLDDEKLSYTEYTFNDTRKCLVVPEGNIEMWSKILLQYENDNLTSEYYQRWLPSSGWTDIDWYQFSYVNGKISDMIHQIWNSSEQNWYNYEKQTYEYHPEEERAYIISQSWDDEWINRYRATNFISNGRLVIDSTQKWQNEEWVDFTACEYSFDGSGNFTEAKWKDYVDGEWVDSDYNTKTIVSYNDGVSILCDYIQSYRARYLSTDSTSELYTTNQTTIFPNPGTNQLTIQADTPFTHVIVYDMTGLQIFSQSVSETAIRINTESWPSGIYFWKAYNSNSAQCGKWVKN